MLAKIPPTYWKVLGVAFTSIIAPVGIRHFDDIGHDPPPAEIISAVATDPTPALPAPAAARILAKGNGPTPDAAFQNAIESALHQAITAEVSAADWRQHSQAYLASVRHNGTGVIRGWHEVSNSSERHLTGRQYQSQVTVDVDVEALRLHLQSVSRGAHH